MSNNDTCDNGSNNNDNDNEVRSHNFAFKSSRSKSAYVNNDLLVNCGATAHIITDKSKSKIFDANFEHASHSIELADGSRATGIVVGKGVTSVNLWDTHGMVQSVELRYVVYISSYKQDIFSVKAAAERGATVIFTPDYAELIAPNGTKFNIQTHQKLYFLNIVCLKGVATHWRIGTKFWATVM